jgi:hypothetical protein
VEPGALEPDAKTFKPGGPGFRRRHLGDLVLPGQLAGEITVRARRGQDGKDLFAEFVSEQELS